MDYHQNLRKNLAAFIASRLIPYLGITVILVFQAHQSFSELSVLAYVLATYAVPVSLLSMLLAVVGNLVALNGSDFIKNQILFRSSLTVAITLAACVFILCLAIHTLWITRLTINTVSTLTPTSVSQIYLLSTPLLVINTFLFYFNEAYSKARSCARIKITATLSAVGLTLATFMTSRSEHFIYFAGLFFVLLELLTLIMYVHLSKDRGLSFKPLLSLSVFKNILAMGLPVALGLGIQKVYFLLLTNRLVRIDSDMVSMLSVSMSIVGLLLIPVAAFSQLHSLYVGNNTRALLSYNRRGSVYLCAFMAVLGGLFYRFSDYFYRFFASEYAVIPAELPLAVTVLFLATALINFSMGQLRAIRDTLIPQAIAGVVLLVGLYPLIAGHAFDDAGLATFLYAEASALVVCYALLQYRTQRLGRRQRPQ